MDSYDVEKEQILTQIESKISENPQHKDAVNVLKMFMRFYYSMILARDLKEYSVDDLYANLLQHWELLHKYLIRQKSVLEVQNASLEQAPLENNVTNIYLVHPNIPFLVYSLRNEIIKQNLAINFMVYPGELWFAVQDNRVVAVSKNKNQHCDQNITLLHIAISQQHSQAQQEELHKSLTNICYDNELVVADWKSMHEKALECAHFFASALKGTAHDEILEAREFIAWLANDNFTFLGCCDYEVSEAPDHKLQYSFIKGSGYGIFSEEKARCFKEDLASLPLEACTLGESQNVLIIGKMKRRATVHRRVYMDYIGVKIFDEQARVVKERRFAGLYTSNAYHSNVLNIPIIRQKLQGLLVRFSLLSDSHASRRLLNIFETFPRDDLFQASEDELYQMCTGILQLQQRSIIRLFVRADKYQRFCSCLLFVPRDKFSSSFRMKISDILRDEFNGDEINFSVYFSESVLARIHFNVRVAQGKSLPDFSVEKIENRIINETKSWQEIFTREVRRIYGSLDAGNLLNKFKESFPVEYCVRYSPQMALYDLKILKDMDSDNNLRTTIYHPEKNRNKIIFKIFRYQEPLLLTDAMPILENLGMTVIGENSFELKINHNESLWVHEFEMYCECEGFSLESMRDNFQACFYNVWYQHCENDAFNRLIVTAGLGWREIVMLRAYAKYFKQIGFNLSENYIQDTLIANPKISLKIVELFTKRLCFYSKLRKELKELEEELLAALELIPNLDEDRILRQYYYVINATIRTNFFQKCAEGKHKDYISFKLEPNKIPAMPKPIPAYEIFVYSPQVEGVHLRSAKVARGGLRWSDRREDFRTEILGLMKAQQVKNSVIVPAGAKGGFVAKKILESYTREEVQAEVISCYQNFISGLLDITDNIQDNKVVAPDDVKCLDDEDPYLVVAADKGTATFSDIANSISEKYNFWLKDAFASGGSVGYDHKKMGITARGAWESVKRHFLELNKDINKEEFTVIGIGDMSGDVFGNGMLLSKHIKLVAAFNHRHIFIDPTPNPVTSFIERERLFYLERSGWDDYNLELISAGGGVFSRSSKKIAITMQMKNLLNIEEDFLEPNQLINRILQADVDLLWNGGIGSYVKARTETNSDVGDKSNDALRINAVQLNCKVVGEGGNLGLTQLARIEAALNGVKLFADFIDNSAGVDCSDHEVNIKILLNSLVDNNKISIPERNTLLESMTDEVAQLVLKNNFDQGQAISLAVMRSDSTLEEYVRFMQQLSKHHKLDLRLEFLPGEKVLMQRSVENIGLTGPELSVLLAASKNVLKEELMSSAVLDNPYMLKYLLREFPKALVTEYRDEIEQHRLRRQIIATKLSNAIINKMGVTYIKRLYDETGASTDLIISGHIIAHDVFELNVLWQEIGACRENNINIQYLYELTFSLVRLVRRSARWFLRNYSHKIDIIELIEKFKPEVQQAWNNILDLLPQDERDNTAKIAQELSEQQLPAQLVHKLSTLKPMYSILDIIEIAFKYNFEVSKVARVYYAIGSYLGLGDFRDKLSSTPVDDNWDALARAGIRDDIDYYQRGITLSYLQKVTEVPDADIMSSIEKWLNSNFAPMVARWQSLFDDLKSSKSSEFTIYAVAVRELMDLALVSRR